MSVQALQTSVVPVPMASQLLGSAHGSVLKAYIECRGSGFGVEQVCVNANSHPPLLSKAYTLTAPSPQPLSTTVVVRPPSMSQHDINTVTATPSHFCNVTEFTVHAYATHTCSQKTLLKRVKRKSGRGLTRSVHGC